MRCIRAPDMAMQGPLESGSRNQLPHRHLRGDDSQSRKPITIDFCTMTGNLRWTARLAPPSKRHRSPLSRSSPCN